MKTALIITGSVVGFLTTVIVSYKVGKGAGLRAAGMDPAQYKAEQKAKKAAERAAA